jgi:hypothetical protein
MMMNPLVPNAVVAKTFLGMLNPDGVFTFQTFDDDKDRKNMSLARVLHGTLDQHIDELTRLQQQGAGAFVMVNAGDGVVHSGSKTCRCTSNVTKVRSLFADLDGAPLEPLLECSPPDIVVESSPGKWHAYYLTSDCPLSEFPLRQKQIAQKFNSDPKVCDLPRVMRVPGFWHQKETPFQTRITFPEQQP